MIRKNVLIPTSVAATDNAAAVVGARRGAGTPAQLETVRRVYRLWAPVYGWVIGPVLLGQEGRLRRTTVTALDLRPGDTVLDLACGTGRNFPLVQDMVGSTGHIIGCDYSPEMLAVARDHVAHRGWTNVTLIQGDVADLTLDRSVDAVLCTLAMSVIPRWQEAIRRAVAVLKPGGMLAIADLRLCDRPAMGPLNAIIVWLCRVLGATDPQRRPWEFMATLLDDVELQNLPLELVYVAWGRKPEDGNGREGVMLWQRTDRRWHRSK